MTRTHFQNANLLDGDNPARKAHVVICGDRIESVGPSPVEARPGDRVIDLAGKTLMPGMINGHFHAAYWGTGGGGGRPVGLEAHPSLQAIRAVNNMKTALECGFTGAISAGAPHQIDAALKAAVDEGTIVGPRLIPGSRDVGTTGFSADMSNPDYLKIGAPTGVTIGDGPDGLRRVVRQEIKDGAQIVKFFLTPSLLFPKEMMTVMAGHAFADSMKEPWDQMAAVLPAASAAGVKLLVGDDYGAFTLNHGRYGEELELYVKDCGVPALDVLRWATKHGAEAMGIDAGLVEAGKLADLVVVDGDPAADISVLKDREKILAVFKGGVAAKDNLVS